MQPSYSLLVPGISHYDRARKLQKLALCSLFFHFFPEFAGPNAQYFMVQAQPHQLVQGELYTQYEEQVDIPQTYFTQADVFDHYAAIQSSQYQMGLQPGVGRVIYSQPVSIAQGAAFSYQQQQNMAKSPGQLQLQGGE
jgi:hypothetical protein